MLVWLQEEEMPVRGGCPAAVELEFRTVSSTKQSRIRRGKN